MAANKNISSGSSFQPTAESSQNRHYENRIRELEAENTRLKDQLAVDEIKLNLVMSCETQFMNPSMTKTLEDLKDKLSEKETQIVQLRKRLRTEEHRSHSATTARDQGEAVVELCESNFQCAVCNELLVKATGLQCGHTFCFECVDKWKKKSESCTDPASRGRKATCPICRSEITTTAPLKNLDAFLEKAVDIFFTDEAKKCRKELMSTNSPLSPNSPTALNFAPSVSHQDYMRIVASSYNRFIANPSRYRLGRGNATRDPLVVNLDDE